MSKEDISVSALSTVRGPTTVRGPLYLLTVESSGTTVSKRPDSYLCIKIDKFNGHIDVVAQKLKTPGDLSNTADELYGLLDNSQLSEMSFSWIRVLSIKNLTYKKVK